MTVDKQVVVFHDGSFARMTEKSSAKAEGPSTLKYNDFPLKNLLKFLIY